MGYHFGICVKESRWRKDDYNSIIVLAADRNDEYLSFFVKIFETNEDINEEVKNIKFGTPVFFSSENEFILNLYNIDCLFGTRSQCITLEDLQIKYSYCSGLEVLRGPFLRRENHTYSKTEIELINSLFKDKLYKHYLSSISEITADNLLNIIKEEESFIESIDIDDLIKELKISFRATSFYIKTDKPESYELFETHTYEGTKYENYILDPYLNQIINLGSRCIGKYEGWFFAKENAEEKINWNTNNIPSIKNSMTINYSKSEHLNFRVRNRLLKFVNPLFTFSCCSGRILDLKKDIFTDFDYKYKHKETLINYIRSRNSNLRGFHENNTFKSKIFVNMGEVKMRIDWCMPDINHHKYVIDLLFDKTILMAVQRDM